MQRYQIIEHTADIGLEISGKDLEELFGNAAFGLFDLITDMSKIEKEWHSGSRTWQPVALELHLTAQDAGDLLLKWLREWLFVFETRRVILVSSHFNQITERELQAVAQGKPFDPRVDEQRHEVKAVTYHHFKLEWLKDRWTARVIFDI